MLILPSIVSMVKLVPSIAYVNVIGIYEWTFSPSSEKTSCSLTLMVSSKSPAGELKQSEACPTFGIRIF